MEYLLIHDPDVDAGRKFPVRPLTRSVAAALDGIEARSLEAVNRLFDGVDLGDTESDAPDTPEQRKAAIDLAHKSPAFRDERIALQCERLDALLEPITGTAGEVRAGVLVAARWEADDVTEQQIDAWVEDAAEKAQKRPR